jgi:hypothetical protein
MKDGFVNSVTSLHQFTENMLEALQHMDHMDAEESHGSQVRTWLEIGPIYSMVWYGGCYNILH